MAGWTDYLPDWSSSNALTLNSTHSALLALTKAVNERSAVVGLSLITEAERLDTISLYAIQSKITKLIPFFVNYETHSGNYTGLSEIPMWNEADILTSIEARSRIAAPVSVYELSANWLYQQYQIINKLIWTNRYNYPSVVDTYALRGTGISDNLENTIDAAINDVNTRYGITEALLNCTYIHNLAPYWGGYAVATKGKIHFSYLYSDLYYSASVYFSAQKPPYYNTAVATFDGGGVAVEGLNFVENVSVSNNSEYTSSLIGNTSVFPKYPPALNYGEWSAIGWQSDSFWMIQEFNIPGGFEFIEEN